MTQSIINFLKSAWGYVVMSGLSLGTIITFVILIIKTFAVSKTIDKASLKEKTSTAIANAREQYFEDVLKVIMVCMQYIIMASKLGIEDKNYILNMINSIDKSKYESLVNAALSELKNVSQDIIDKEKSDAVDTVTEAVENAKTLLDKYS